MKYQDPKLCSKPKPNSESLASGRLKVAFIYYSSLSSFIKNDYNILSRYFNVREVNIKSIRDMLKLARSIIWCDLSFVWFAGKHAFPAVILSKLLMKKSIVVVGGYDVAYLPEINYGQFASSWSNRMCAKFALKYADKVLVVDPSLKEDAIRNANVDGRNFEYLPTGYNFSKFHPRGEKENLVLTVAPGESWDRVRIKGVDIFVESAKYLPDIRFLVIGIQGAALSKLKERASPNTEFVGPISQEELITYYQKAKVYCQLSMREGLPNALCEAMLCECIPVGTKRNGIPTAIGDIGFYVEYGNSEETAKAIKLALASPAELGRKGRERIKNQFPEERRELGLARIINELANCPIH
jgi:glycosyltransferase involved in cell wall biosynthesis